MNELYSQTTRGEKQKSQIPPPREGKPSGEAREAMLDVVALNWRILGRVVALSVPKYRDLPVTPAKREMFMLRA